MIRHFAGVAEIVEDFEAAVQFYRDTLGLEVESLSEGYATATIPGVLHFGIWSRAEAAEATYGSSDAAEHVPLGFTIAFRGRQRNRGSTASQKFRRGSGSAHQDRAVGTGNQPLHNAQRRPLRNCRNSLGAPHHAADVGRVGRCTLTNPPRHPSLRGSLPPVSAPLSASRAIT